MNFLLYLFFTLFIAMAVILVLLVLIQKGRGGGLASAFGGGGGNTAFGSKTGDVLTWATSIVFGVFLLLAVAANLLATQIHQRRNAAPVVAPAGSTAGSPLGGNAPVVSRPQQPNPPATPAAGAPPPTASEPLPATPGQPRNPMTTTPPPQAPEIPGGTTAPSR